MKDATAAFIILSNIIMATSSAALAIAEETVAEVTVLIQRRNANNQSNVNSPSVVRRRTTDHRQLPRGKRRKFAPREAYYCIMRDFLGPDPLHGAEFKLMFGISRTRFERISKVLSAKNDFFRDKIHPFGLPTTTWQAKMLLPMKTLSHGVATYTFIDYFSMSATQARQCFYQYINTMSICFAEEYLRTPTPSDLKSILVLHERKHAVQGMFGSLDCMHIFWKNCPKGYHGQYKGKEKKPSIVLEAACDYNLWFWHASFGYPGTLNDINILNLSPLVDSFLDGSFEKIEETVVPYKLNGENFRQVFLLADGIYPCWSRFVRTISDPVGNIEKNFSKWQESARKDIERAFGVLQGEFKVLSKPMQALQPDVIGAIMSTCLICHNMNVEDRVMGEEVEQRYDPKISFFENSCEIDDRPTVENETRAQSCIGVNAVNDRNFERGFIERWCHLDSRAEHVRLNDAIRFELLGKRSARKGKDDCIEI